MVKKIYGFLVLVLYASMGAAQTDTLSGEGNVVISAYKWEQKTNEIPNRILKIEPKDISAGNPQTAADMLAQSGAVFVQKSQLGGGSPMIRGFATNRVMLVLDGVRMNNAIYRSGNLQNVISIDPLALQEAEVIFGPGSIIYGSDAIGGVMDFHSLEAAYKRSKESKNEWQGSALARTSTANREQTYHAHLHWSSNRLAWVGSATFSSFDHLRMGRHGGFAGYERPAFVQRIGGTDSIVPNPDPRRQVFSGYNQWNVLQKLKWKISEHTDLQYTFHYAGTGTHARYDRLIETRNNALRFAEWDYGPMLMRMHILKAKFGKKTALYDEARLVAGYQNYEESRIDRQRNSLQKRTQAEAVKAYTFNADAIKALWKGELYYGAELVHNDVYSRAWQQHIDNGTLRPVATRYPNGSLWQSLGAYTLTKQNVSPKLTLNGGLRYTQGRVRAAFSQAFFPLPFTEARLNSGALTGSTGLVYRPAEGWQLNLLGSTGFRLPNIDDIGKLFESNPGNVIVPNANLRSEYAWNAETGIVRHLPGKYRVEASLFFTRLSNAIVRRPFQLQGADSIVFDGVLSQVEALQNIGFATVWGVQALAEVYVHPLVKIYTLANYINGRETDDNANKQVALRHAPPFYGSSGIKLEKKKWFVEAFMQYNSEVAHQNLAPVEQAKVFIYARDANGNTFSPGWHTVNLRTGFHFGHYSLHAAWENITNRQYRPYSSGIVAAGSNLILSVRASF